MRILFSPEYSGAVFARANDGSDVMMDTVVLNTMGLIDMLELRLGLHYEDIPQNERLAHYYDAVCKYMAENPNNIMSASFKTELVSPSVPHFFNVLTFRGIFCLWKEHKGTRYQGF